MIIQFTPVGAAQATTLANDTVRPPYPATIEQLGGQSLVQLENLAGGANPALFPRGNVSGDFVFRSRQSYADLGTTWTVFQSMFALLNSQGTIVLMQDAATLMFSNAILKGVNRIFGSDTGGVHMEIRYTFAITTIAL